VSQKIVTSSVFIPRFRKISSDGPCAGLSPYGHLAIGVARPGAQPVARGHKLAFMRATLYYTALRLGLFAVALGLLYLVGARSILLVGLAAVISAIVSYLVLARYREAMAGSISQRISNARERLDEGTRAEDAD
jgi:Protein of unknown function (DUF4229)